MLCTSVRYCSSLARRAISSRLRSTAERIDFTSRTGSWKMVSLMR